MRIRIDRAWKKKGYTISRVIVNGVRFGDGEHWCSILEDEDRGLDSTMSLDEIAAVKVKGATAIPRGVYEIKVTYSPRFKRNLPILLETKGFVGVRIHGGNSAEDTEGCLLPGVNNVVGRVTNSRYWANILQHRIEQAIAKGERVFIEVG